MKLRPDLAAVALCALACVGIVVLAVFHLPIPDVLTFVATTALGVGGGAAFPVSSSSATPAPAAAVPPARTGAEPVTGVFSRIAP